MILSDGTIRRLLAEGRIAIDPMDESQIQPASVDVRLGNSFLVFRRHTSTDIDPWETNDSLMEPVEVPDAPRDTIRFPRPQPSASGGGNRPLRLLPNARPHNWLRKVTGDRCRPATFH